MAAKDDNWYHGKLTRLEAEQKLRDHGFTEGLFLIRESSSSLGSFVMSVVCSKAEDGIVHYQISRRGEQDALFSLSVEEKVIHGLDELVFYYFNHQHSGLQHKLTSFVPGDKCPSSVRLHGVNNLLHRAAMAGDALVVSELLNCGRDVRARNEDGHCAIHLAAFKGHNSVLELLINHKADKNDVNVANSSGYTPLHVACQSNQAEALKTLLKAGANPTIRNQVTSWVPLHEAAWNGFIDCAKSLMNEGQAPLMPRTEKDETPFDLAEANSQTEMADFLRNMTITSPHSEATDWLYLNQMGRQDAIDLLSLKPDDGTFLIRESQKRRNVFVLSLVHKKAFHHVLIENRGVFYFLDPGPYFTSLMHLVDHYMRFSDGLPCKLRHPVKRHTKPPRPVPHNQDLNEPEVPPRTLSRGPNPSLPCNLKPVVKRDVYKNNNTLRRVRHSVDDIPMESIKMTEIIGEGEFGTVYKGQYMTEEGEVQGVAIKVLHDIGERQAATFVREASNMMQIDHHCIVRLIGVSQTQPTMVLELVQLGSMLDYLQEKGKNSVRPEMELTLWAAQISCGMMYLEKKRFIHRDLAARNILLASKLQAKISDFGLSTAVSEGKDYYQASQGGRWPIKWYAPESVNYGTFSHASDVWSFGVLLWEMYTFGDQPYDGMTGGYRNNILTVFSFY